MNLISPTNVREATYDTTLWRAIINAGTPFEDLLKPEFWALVSSKMRPTDIIQCVAEDNAYFVELLVLDCSSKWAKVKLLRKVDISAEEAAPIQTATDYELVFRGPRRWSVKRQSDGQIVSENHHTREDASGWLAEHNKVMAA
jgi:hypothetical protein